MTTIDLIKTVEDIDDGHEHNKELVWEINQKGVYIHVSPGVRDILGYEPDEVIGKSYSDFFTKREKAMQDAGKILPGIQKWVHKDGHEVPLRVTNSPVFNYRGDIIGCWGSAKIDESEDTNTFIRTTAHDLKNTQTAFIEFIRIIKGMFEEHGTSTIDGVNEIKLREILGKKKIEETYGLLEAMQQAATESYGIIYPLLTFPEVVKEKKEIAPLPKLIESVIETTDMYHDIFYERNYSEGLWPVNVYSTQIKRAFGNLVLNSIQAMPDGGTISIAANNEVVREKLFESLLPGRYVKVSISDDGTGIPSEVLGGLFRPGFTTKENGNGLGLFYVRSTIKNHQGHISVESRPGKTTFTMYLPASADNLPKR